MPLFEEVVIDLKFVELPKDYMYYKQHQLHWMCHFACVHGRCYLLECDSWKVEMVKHGKTTCIIAHHVIILMWITKLTHLWLWSLPT